MIYHFSFIHLKTLLRPRSRFFAVPQTEGKLVGKTWFAFFPPQRRFFSPKKKSGRLTKKTHKKSSISFVSLCDAPVWKENKYWGSLNLWTIYIWCVIFLSGWRSFPFVRCCMMILLSWFLLMAFRASLILHSCNWFLTFFLLSCVVWGFKTIPFALSGWRLAKPFEMFSMCFSLNRFQSLNRLSRKSALRFTRKTTQKRKKFFAKLNVEMKKQIKG